MTYLWRHWDPHLTTGEGILAVIVGCALFVLVAELLTAKRHR
jgi:hypothetical protein